MVLSTLHTNDAPSSITRLVDIGIEPYLISAAVNGALAQRLLRRICENCKEPLTVVPESITAYLEKHSDRTGQLYCGTGCEICHNTGYKGRIGIYELLVLNEELRDIITHNPSLGDLKAAAKKQGMRSLRDDGLQKAFEGMTTVEELIRITES